MSSENIAAQITKAWGAHREGRNADAIAEFNRILKDDSDNIDAYYGLGLAQKANGQTETAIKSFQTAYKLVKDAFDKLQAAPTHDPGSHTPILSASTENDRLMMLLRMLRQRLEELKAPVE